MRNTRRRPHRRRDAPDLESDLDITPRMVPMNGSSLPRPVPSSARMRQQPGTRPPVIIAIESWRERSMNSPIVRCRPEPARWTLVGLLAAFGGPAVVMTVTYLRICLIPRRVRKQHAQEAEEAAHG